MKKKDIYLNYKGAWSQSYFPFKYEKQNGFQLTVKLLKRGKFEGTCNDFYGKSKIEGKLSKNLIEFTKQYTLEGIHHGGAAGKLSYIGVRKEVIKEGNLVELVSGLITCEFPEEMRPKNFVMERID
ncbi:MAG: hypothetical protein AABW81_00180 [Nanoarchaeota archaeon]